MQGARQAGAVVQAAQGGGVRTPRARGGAHKRVAGPVQDAIPVDRVHRVRPRRLRLQRR